MTRYLIALALLMSSGCDAAKSKAKIDHMKERSAAIKKKFEQKEQDMREKIEKYKKQLKAGKKK